jgi:hypothetical protein
VVRNGYHQGREVLTCAGAVQVTVPRVNDKRTESAQDHWRMVNAPHLVALVRAGAAFINGKLVERPGEETQEEGA